MAEFDRSEHTRPDAVIDSAYEDFDAASDRDRRRIAMAIGGPLFALILTMAVVIAIQARNGQNEEAGPPQVELMAQEPPLVLPQATNEEMVAALQQLRAEQPLVLTEVDQGALVVLANPRGNPWFLGPGLLWLLAPILAITLIPLLRSQRWDPD